MPVDDESTVSRKRSARRSPVFSDRGIVLRSHRLGESDKILRIFTREHGKRSAVAKGVRRTTSRFGARLEPLTCARLLMHEGRSMDVIKQADIEVSSRETREDLDLFLRGAAMAEVVDIITEEHEPNPDMFDLLASGLEALGEPDCPSTFLLAFFEYRAMALAGFELRTAGCAVCGEGVPEGDAFFSINMGGIVCETCRMERRGEVGRLIRVSETAVRMLSWMAGHEIGEWPPESRETVVDRELFLLMDRVVEHWMERQFPAHRVLRSVSSELGADRKGR